MRLRVIVPMLLLAVAAPASANTTGGASPGAPEIPHASATSGSVSISTRGGGMLRRTKRFSGTAPAGRTVTIERMDALTGQWNTIAVTTAKDNGTYRARWKPDALGAVRLRVRAGSGDAQASAAPPEVDVYVFKPGVATWYGPGFYGNKTACGQKLTKGLLGVAHKTHPCGTQVALLYKGRTLTVPVVDRGPFREGTKWDLTSATAQALGFTGTDTVGAIAVSG